jgi:hypothetical protein
MGVKPFGHGFGGKAHFQIAVAKGFGRLSQPPGQLVRRGKRQYCRCLFHRPLS